ncbi:hypothetical protein C5167_047792 [Papaver somniferum]|uniref:Uncharacterized protein n=1 Tax=Papaver somniferum TaxID=3469 RepID=A0A4Y7LJ77_PAPSO|nr:hypothetical protein C5167_047792 [Papaver somniferum]
MGSSSSTKIVMALVLSFLLLGHFCAEAEGRINDEAATPTVCFQQQERCPSGQDCNSCCKSSLGYSRGGVMLLGSCCCIEGSMKV